MKTLPELITFIESRIREHKQVIDNIADIPDLKKLSLVDKGEAMRQFLTSQVDKENKDLHKGAIYELQELLLKIKGK